MSITRTSVTRTVTSVTSGTSGRARFTHASGNAIPVGTTVTNSGFGVGGYNVTQTVTASSATYYELSVAYSANSTGSGAYYYISVVGSKDSGTATSATATTLTDSGKTWTTNAYASRHFVSITGGTGAGQVRDIVSNTATALTINRAWGTTPDATSTYSISYSLEDVKSANDSGAWGKVTKTGSHYLIDLPIVVGDGSTYSPFGDAGGVSFEITKAQSEYKIWSATSVALLNGRDNSWFRFGRVVDETKKVTTDGVVYKATTTLTLPEFLTCSSGGNIEFLGSTFNSDVTGFFWHLAGTAGKTFRAWNSTFNGVDVLQGSVATAGTIYSIADMSRLLIDKKNVANGIGLRAKGDVSDIQIMNATLGAVSPLGFGQTTEYRNIKARNCANAVRHSSNIVGGISGGCLARMIDCDLDNWGMRFDGSGKVIGTDTSQRVWSLNLSSSNATDGLRFALYDKDGTEVFNDVTASGVLPEKLVIEGEWINKTTTNGELQTEAEMVTRNPHHLNIRKYGKKFQARTGVGITNAVVEGVNDEVNPYIEEASESAVGAYTGLAYSGSDGAMLETVTAEHTPQSAYDYSQYHLVTSSLVEFILAVAAKNFDRGTTRQAIGSGGEMTITETDGIYKFGSRADATIALDVASGGALIVGTEESLSTLLDFMMLQTNAANNANELWGSLRIQAGGDFDWLGGTIQSHCNLSFYGNVSIASQACLLLNQGYSLFGGNPPQIRQRSASTNVQGLTTSGFTITMIVVPSVWKNVKVTNVNFGYAPSSSSPANTWIPIEAPSFENITVAEVAFWANMWIRLIKSATGTDIRVQGQIEAGSVNNKGLTEVRHPVTLNIPTGATWYTKDTNNGSRLAANQVGTNPDYTADRTYTATSSGGAASYDTDGGILTGVFWRTDASGLGNANNIFDSRGRANDKTDVFRMAVCAYGYQPRLIDYVLKGTAGLTDTPAFLQDLGITQTNQATVAAYTGFSGETATTVTITSAHTTSEVYDRRKYQEQQNPSWFYDNAETMCSSAAGVQYDLSASYTVTLQATLSGKKISGGVLVLGTGWVLTCPVDGATLSFPNAGTYDLRGADLSGTITLANTSGGAVTVYVPADVTLVNSGPSITVIEPQIFQSVTVSGLTASQRVQLFDVTSDTELVNALATGATLTWTDSVPYAADRQIRLRVMYADGTAIQMEDRVIGTATESAPAVAYSFQAEIDPVYAENGIDGSTVTGITINDASMILEIDSGTVTSIGGVDVVQVPLQRLYAFETWWLYTEEGIRDEARFIHAIDGANYEFDSFKIRNDTGYPVVIVGGYARDAATGQSATLTDYSGGAIHYAPDHVVNNVVNVPTAAEVAAATRDALPEVANMDVRVAELWALQGLDVANPMTVTATERTAGDITLDITGDGETITTVTRAP